MSTEKWAKRKDQLSPLVTIIRAMRWTPNDDETIFPPGVYVSKCERKNVLRGKITPGLQLQLASLTEPRPNGNSDEIRELTGEKPHCENPGIRALRWWLHDMLIEEEGSPPATTGIRALRGSLDDDEPFFQRGVYISK
jgi:hypothetical protein